MIAIAGQEVKFPGGVGKLQAERIAVAGQAGRVVAGVDVDVADFARPVGLVGGIGVVLHAADDRDVAAFRVLKAEAVVAMRLVQSGRRIDDVEPVRDHLGMQRIDRGAVGGVEHHADQRRLGELPDRQDVMKGTGAAEIMRAGIFADMGQIPDVGEEAPGLVEFGKSDIDAAQGTDFGADSCLAHSGSPRNRAALS